MAQLAPVVPVSASVPPVRAMDDPAGLLGVDEARDRILAAFAPLGNVRLPIVDALGMVLAVDVIAGANVPPFANAAMDGFAVRAADTVGASPASPVPLRVLAEAPAGRPIDGAVVPGTAVRIMTGAPIPGGADAIVRFEETDENAPGLGGRGRPGGMIGVLRAARPAANVRPAGEDIRTGETALPVGTGLRPAEIGVLASLNRTHATVHRRPRVAIVATGDEIVDPGQKMGEGQIRNSNSATVAALVRRCGGEPVVLGVARDARASVRAKLAEARGADLIITTGGVSVGDYDVVKHVLRQEGRIDLWQVRLKPGKPLAFGRVGGTPLLGLPGNPVAAAVAFEQFARPAIRKMLGHWDPTIPTLLARLADRVENGGGRRHFVRVRVEATADGHVAHLAGAQGAGILTSLARANGLLVIPEEVSVAESGSMLPVQMLDWGLA